MVPEFPALGNNIIHYEDKALKRRFDSLKFSWIDWSHWVVLLAFGATVILVEIRNHSHMWKEHQSGQTIFTDPELIMEIFLFGLILPFLAGVVFSYMKRSAVEKEKIARNFDLHRMLLRQMDETQDWPELIKYIVSAPGAFTDAERAWLLAQRSDDDIFKPIASWERQGEVNLPAPVPISPSFCEQCLRVSSHNYSRLTTCRHLKAPINVDDRTRHCLGLSNGLMGQKSVLLFDMPNDHPLKQSQIIVLNDLGKQFSLAIENANLRLIEKQQVDSAMKERLRIARNLHDTLGQNISYLRLKLEHLSSADLIADGEAHRKELEKLLIVAEEAYEQMRDTLDELKITEQKPFEEIVRKYANQAGKRSGFSVGFHSSGKAVPLPPRFNTQMVYILREALNNVEKHSGAQIVDVILHWADANLTMKIEDNGQGFAPDLIGETGEYGLEIMAERAHISGAEFSIDSVPGRGTTVTVNLPLMAHSSTIKLMSS